jgi:multidrug efflux pump subunit AcrA (membrane-fusion protein)
MNPKFVIVTAIAVIMLAHFSTTFVNGQPISQTSQEESGASTSVTRVLRLKHANAPDLAIQIERLFGIPVVADIRTNQMTVHTTKKGVETVLDYVKELDVPSALPTGKAQNSFVRTSFLVAEDGSTIKYIEHDVVATIDGVVAEVLVDNGQTVKAGQELVKLRNTDLDLEIEKVRGEINVAQARIQSLEPLKNDKLSKDEVTRNRREQDVVMTTLKSLEHQYELLNKKKEDLIVRSPINGNVVTQQLSDRLKNRPVEKGTILLTVAAETKERDVVETVGPSPLGALPAGASAGTPVRGQYAPFQHLGWPETHPESELRTPAYVAAETQVGEIAAKYRTLVAQISKPLKRAPIGDRADWELTIEMPDLKQRLAALKAKLKSEVETAFQERQKSQSAELEQLRNRLTQIEQTISDREKNREAIINHRVEELISPNPGEDARMEKSWPWSPRFQPRARRSDPFDR